MRIFYCKWLCCPSSELYYHLTVRTSTGSHVSRETVNTVRGILARRMTVAAVSGTVTVQRDGSLCAVIPFHDLKLDQIFTDNGDVLLKILPKGPTYSPPNHKIFREAMWTNDDHPAIFVKMNNPSSFYAFTSRYEGRYPGLFIDNKLVEWPTINSLLSDTVKIEGANISTSRARVWAALFSSGPFPSGLRITPRWFSNISVPLSAGRFDSRGLAVVHFELDFAQGSVATGNPAANKL
jgi:hypothetical protein